MLQQALPREPSNPLLYYSLGAKLGKSARGDEAIKLYRVALQDAIDKGHGRLHSAWAICWCAPESKPEAIPEYEESVRMNPAETATQPNLAATYMESGRLARQDR